MIRSILFNYAGMVVTGLVGFLLTPVLIHGLGDFHYGMWILVASIVDYYGLADIGIRFTLQRHVARWKGADQREAVDRTFATALAMSLGFSVVIIVISAVLARLLPPIFRVSGPDRDLFVRVLLLLGVSFAVALPAKVLGAYLCGLQRFDLYNLVGSGTTVAQAMLILWVLHRGYGIEGCAAVALGVASLSLVLHWRFVRLADPEASLDLRQTTWADLGELFSFGFYVFVNQVGDLFRFRLDSLVIARWLNISLVTHFNVAARLVEYFRYVSAAIVGPLVTEMSRLDGQGEQEGLQRLLLRSTRLTALLSLFIGALMFLNGRALLSLWVGNTYVSSYAVLVTLVAGRAATTLQSPSMVLLLARGRHRALGCWTLCEGLVNLVLSIFWARKYGILGVAMGTAMPMLLFRLVVQPWYTLRVARVSAWRYYTESLTRPVLVLVVFVALERLTNFPSQLTVGSFVLSLLWQISLYSALTSWIGLTAPERREMWGALKTRLSGQGVAALGVGHEETVGRLKL
jgi:O-antigen/teichoic acid export membrane protein